MSEHHLSILDEIKKHKDKVSQNKWGASYLGSSNLHYGISNPIKRQIIKNWSLDNKDISLEEFIDLLSSLYKGESYEEKCMAGMFLGYFPKLRAQIDIELLDFWLGHLNGWAEVDSTCQSNFQAAEILNNWDKWKKLIEMLSQDKNINKRRASLVLLTGVVSRSVDKRLSDLAFFIIDRLKAEKEILITKAISWLLRDLTYLHKEEVGFYLNNNVNFLPKIAVRETRRKLLTGRK